MAFRLSKKLMTFFALIVVSVGGIFFFGKPNDTSAQNGPTHVDIATINVKAGYTPQEVTLPANKISTLRFVTNNTYDCSASILIPTLQIEKLLPPTGVVDVEIPAQLPGTEIVAGCSMGGMYNFKIKFL